MTDDGWSSRSQDSYSSANAHFISEEWLIKSYTLCTQLMEDCHRTEKLKVMFNMINEVWNISGKINAVEHDNASNITMATDLLDDVRCSISCAAHTLQLRGLNLVDRFKDVIKKGSKIVQHFNHSNLATSALSEKKRQLGLNE
jgi:hypothetical protein